MGMVSIDLYLYTIFARNEITIEHKTHTQRENESNRGKVWYFEKHMYSYDGDEH